MQTLRPWPIVILFALITAGCGREQTQPAPEGKSPAVENSEQAQIEAALANLPEEDRAAAREQRICPVSGEPLGSMGTPIKTNLDGTEVFICCAACEKPLRADPEKYLAKLDKSE